MDKYTKKEIKLLEDAFANWWYTNYSYRFPDVAISKAFKDMTERAWIAATHNAVQGLRGDK